MVATTGRPKRPTKINAPRQPKSSIRAAVAGGAAANPILPTKVWKANDRPSRARPTERLRIA
jgi:hypothetical protein